MSIDYLTAEQMLAGGTPSSVVDEVFDDIEATEGLVDLECLRRARDESYLNNRVL